ncbi:MAG: BTAD domain-containing putative transcriptional regulator [Desulfosalsimonas sp.]
MISKPVAPKMLSREHLFDLIDGLRSRCPTIWISGPPGSGKTLLTGGYLKAKGTDSIWYRSDETLSVTDGNEPFSPYRFYASLFESITARMQPCPESGVRNPLAIVFDNYEKLPFESLFHEASADAIENLPSGIFIIFISRCSPPPAFTRIRSQGKIGFINPDDLRLSPAESEAILRSKRKGPVSADLIHEIHTLSEGWAAGLFLLGELINDSGLADANPEMPSRDEVFAYLEKEVFARRAAEDAGVLMQTAFLPEMTEKTAAAVTGRSDAGRILLDLYQNNLFIQRRPGRTPVYAFHKLFREFLAARIQKHYRPEKIKHLQLLSAEVLESSGQIEDSAELYTLASDAGSLTRLVRDWAPVLIRQGKHLLLEKWICSVQRDWSEAPAFLEYWLGVSKMPHDPAGARLELEKAFAAAEETENLKVLSWSAIVYSYCLEWNDFHGLDYWIEWMEKALASGLVFRTRQAEAWAAAGMSTALMIRRPQHRHIDYWTERCFALIRELTDADLRVQKYMFLAFFYFWRGDLARFRFVRKEIEDLAGLPEISPLSRLTLPCIDAFIDIWLQGSYESALDKIGQALADAADSGVYAWNHMFLCLRAYCFLVRGELRQAGHALKEVAGLLHDSRRHLYSHYYYLLAWHSYLQGDIELAKVQADAAVSYADQTGYVFPSVLCLIQNAWISWQAGDTEAAWARLARAQKLSGDIDSAIMTYAGELVEAALLIAGGGEGAGLEVFKKAVSLGRARGFVTPPWWCEPPFIRELCGRALQYNIETGHVTSFVYRQRMIIAPPEKRFYPNWPRPARVFTLGRYELFLWDKPVAFSGKVQKKPLEMLKVLIALGGRNIPRERITDILWPDADGDMARRSFATTLHRLRQLMGSRQPIVLNEGRISINSQYLWVDALSFLRHSQRLDRQWNSAPDARTIQEAQQLLDLYQGPFLQESLETAWAAEFQGLLQRRCLILLEHLGDFYQQKGKWKEAIACYERAVEIDPLAEAFYLRLMQCYADCGWTGEVFRIYQQCRRNLKETLGIEPSDWLYNRFKKVLSR